MFKQTLFCALGFSALALAQAETIRKAVSSVITHRSFELVPITTTGDTFEGDLPALGGKGLFVTDIQEAQSRERTRRMSGHRNR